MRCPKCGFISFDNLEECRKCGKDIQAAASVLHGSVYKTDAPVFLQIQTGQQQELETPVDLFADDTLAEADEYVDEDLEILVEDPDEIELEETEEIAFADDGDFELSMDDEELDLELEGDVEAEDEGGIEIDLSQFEDNFTDTSADSEPEEITLDEEEPARAEVEPFEMPAALADISDLAPPTDSPESVAETPQEDDFKIDEPRLDLDDLDFDLDLDDLGGEVSEEKSEKILALDEIDFSETLGSPSPEPSLDGSLNMDDDLDFDLDLGGLSIHKDD